MSQTCLLKHRLNVYKSQKLVPGLKSSKATKILGHSLVNHMTRRTH